VGAAAGGGNEVYIGFPGRSALFRPGHGPGGAFPFGEAVAIHRFAGVFLADDHGDHQIRAVQQLGQVAAHSILVGPFLGLAGALDVQGDLHPGQQHGLGAQDVLQLAHGNGGGIEILGIGPGTHPGAAGLLGGIADAGQGLHHVASSEDQTVHAAFPGHFHFQTGRERVGHRDADPVQAAGEAVGAAGALVELATRVQAGEHHFHRGRVFHRMQIHRNAAAVVSHGNGAIHMDGHQDALGEAGNGFVGRVVDDFLDDVQGIFGPGVHARALLHRLQSLEDGNRRGVVFGRSAHGAHRGERPATEAGAAKGGKRNKNGRQITKSAPPPPTRHSLPRHFSIDAEIDSQTCSRQPAPSPRRKIKERSENSEIDGLMHKNNTNQCIARPSPATPGTYGERDNGESKATAQKRCRNNGSAENAGASDQHRRGLKPEDGRRHYDLKMAEKLHFQTPESKKAALRQLFMLFDTSDSRGFWWVVQGLNL